jgi:hypothetical protein
MFLFSHKSIIRTSHGRLSEFSLGSGKRVIQCHSCGSGDQPGANIAEFNEM